MSHKLTALDALKIATLLFSFLAVLEVHEVLIDDQRVVINPVRKGHQQSKNELKVPQGEV